MLSVEACASPQDSPDLLLLLRLLALGQGAWDMIDSQVFKEPKMVTGVRSCLTFAGGSVGLKKMSKVGPWEVGRRTGP